MKKILLSLATLLSFTIVNAQATEGDTITVGELNYVISLITLESEVEVVGFSDAPVASVTIPETINGGNSDYIVVAVGTSAFENEADLTNVTLPSSVKTLKNRSFAGCTGLISINCDDVIELENSALSNLTSLTDYGSFDSLTTMASNSFFKINQITSFELPETLTFYDTGVGNTFSSVDTFNIPSTVTNIGNAFFRFVQLGALQVNWSADQLNGTNGETAVVVNAKNFLGTIDLSTVTLYVPTDTKSAYEAHERFSGFNIVEGTLADYVPTIKVGDNFTEGDNTYEITSLDDSEVGISGSTLANVVVPETVTYGGVTYNVVAVVNDAFLENTNLISVDLPSSVITLKQNSFSGCTNLETINLKNVVTLTGQNVFFNCNKLTTANLSSATELGNFAFHGADGTTSSLTSVDISSAVNLGKAVFSRAQFTTINIPATVDSIGIRAFWNCTALTEVSVNWTTAEEIAILDISQTVPASTDPDTSEEIAEDLGDATFLGVDVAKVNLLVPKGTQAFYTAAVGWQDFNIVEVNLSTEDIIAGTLDIQVSSEELSVNSSSTFTNGNLSIYDITGRALSSTILNRPSATVNISNLSSGIYIVKVTEGNVKLVKRFVKQ